MGNNIGTIQNMKALKFIDLFAGLGGFHLALKELGHECVFASEINTELQKLYEHNHKIKCVGDINLVDIKKDILFYYLNRTEIFSLI